MTMKVLIQNNIVVATNQSAITRCVTQDGQELINVDVLPSVGQVYAGGKFIGADNSAQEGYEWAKSELESSDIEIKYHERGSKRAELTVQAWYDYQELLRDYATVDNDGVYSTSGDRPTRPS